MGISETRIKGKRNKVIHHNYRLIGSGEEDGRHGVAFILHPNIAVFEKKSRTERLRKAV